MTEQLAAARGGLSAWMHGDVSGVAELLAPDVELLWWTPGDWDCRGKASVVSLLTERAQSRTPSDVEISELDDATLLVSSQAVVADGPDVGLQPATIITFRDGLVVRMQQYRSRDEALAHVHE